MAKKNFNIPIDHTQYQMFADAAVARNISTSEMGRTCLFSGYKIVVENQNPDAAEEANKLRQELQQLQDQLANTQRDEARKSQEAQQLLIQNYEEKITTLKAKIEALESRNPSSNDDSNTEELEEQIFELMAKNEELENKVNFFQTHSRVVELFEKLKGQTHNVNTHTGAIKEMSVENIDDVWAIIAEAFRV
jgi:chromosome segregation ATPase